MSELVNAIKTGVNTGLLGAKTCFPAIVRAVDYANQTLQAEIAIQQIIDGENVNYPLLVDVPFVITTCQNYHITIPIKIADEVLILFADRCIDGWFSSGEVQKQVVHRVHDISDGFALIGINSKPNKINNYDENSLVIKSDAGDTYIVVHTTGLYTSGISMIGNLDVDGSITATGDIAATGDVTAGSISLKNHTHPGVQTGSGNTGPPQ